MQVRGTGRGGRGGGGEGGERDLTSHVKITRFIDMTYKEEEQEEEEEEKGFNLTRIRS